MMGKSKQPPTEWEIANIDDLISYWRVVLDEHIRGIKSMQVIIQSLSDEREKLVKRQAEKAVSGE